MIEERERMFEKLKKLSFLKPVPSQANFILCEVIEAMPNTYRMNWKNEASWSAIIIPRCCATISVSAPAKPEQTDKIMQALQEIGEK